MDLDKTQLLPKLPEEEEMLCTEEEEFVEEVLRTQIRQWLNLHGQALFGLEVQKYLAKQTRVQKTMKK